MPESNIDLPIVSIIVPCYNEEGTIVELLTSIDAQDYPQELLEIIIADGMSEDRTREKINRFIETHSNLAVQLIDNPDRSIPQALNEAIAASSGDIILRLDAHSVPNEDYISRCVQVLEQTGAANVGGIWMIRPGADTTVAKSIANAAAHPLGAGDARYRILGEAGPMETVPFGAFRRAWLEKIGPFNEKLLSNEDYEYNVRIRQAGGVVWFDPEIKSVYFARPTLMALARQYWRYGYWKAQMLRRYPRSVRLRQLIPPVFVLSLLFLTLASPFFGYVRTLLAVELGFYSLVTIASALIEAWKRKNLSLIVSFPLAILVMHLSWGSGFLVSIGKINMGRKE